MLALAGAIATGATAASSADPGITDKTILLGGTAPLSGPASAYASVARGANAYFKYVNARGGVNGRTINYKFLDDAYNAAQSRAGDAASSSSRTTSSRSSTPSAPSRTRRFART